LNDYRGVLRIVSLRELKEILIVKVEFLAKTHGLTTPGPIDLSGGS
jgi:hypothetical protein